MYTIPTLSTVKKSATYIREMNAGTRPDSPDQTIFFPFFILMMGFK